MAKYTIRCYAIISSPKQEILLLNETYKGKYFTKFPGGGLEPGEGILDCLKRELKEELNLDVSEFSHFYTTDFYTESAFHKNTQVISVYYLVQSKIDPQTIILSNNDDKLISMKWVDKKNLLPSHLTFPIDKKVVELMRTQSF